MRILLDARLYGLENAGLGRYAINLVDNLKVVDTKNEYVILLREKYYKSLKLPKNWEKVLADFGHYTVAEQLKLPRLLSKHQPNLVHFLHFNVPIFFRGKFVVTIHDLLMQQHRGRQATTLPPHLYYSKILAAKLTFASAVKRAVKIIVPSQAVKDEVSLAYKIPEGKIKAIYEGVDYQKFSEGKNIDTEKYGITKPYFLYVGNAYPHKNLPAAITAIGSLFKQSVNINLVLSCSRNAFTEKLDTLIQKQDAGEFVKFLGFVPDEDLPGLYKNSVGFVYPSLSEGFGLQGLEAMAAGTLVAASDIPVFKEVYKENAFYFDPKDVESVERVLKQMLEMKDQIREGKIAHAREFVKRYSWRTMAEETLEVYNSV